MSLMDILTGLPPAIAAVRRMPLWQLLTLAFYTLGSFAGTFAATRDWKIAVPIGLGFFVAHAHGQAQPSTVQKPSAAATAADAKAQAAAAQPVNKSDLEVLRGGKF